MKRIILSVIAILFVTTSFSQKMMTRSGEIKFESTFPGALEEIAATNKSVSSIFDKSNGDFVAQAQVKAFKFKIPLMEEHFNENYIESTTYPKADFKGKIVSFDASKLTTNKPITYDLEGNLTLHGVTNKIKTKITLTLVGTKITATSNFNISNAAYKINIPSLVRKKVTDEVKMQLNFVLEEKK